MKTSQAIFCFAVSAVTCFTSLFCGCAGSELAASGSRSPSGSSGKAVASSVSGSDPDSGDSSSQAGSDSSGSSAVGTVNSSAGSSGTAQSHATASGSGTTSSSASGSSKSGSSSSSQATVSRIDTVYINANDYLTVSNGNLVNRYGDTVVLNGVNLGGWLIQECWMCPVNSGSGGDWGNLDTINAFKKQGFTDAQFQKLFDTYQDNWITEYDLDIIAGTGANCVRVPFWYRNFMLDESGTWIDSNLDRNPGFQRLDWIIQEAGERGVYVILDMHGCPGGQSMNHCTGTVGRNELYSNSTYRNTMKKLWVAIAKRYKGNPAVAALDIMNEPQNNDGYEKAANYVSAWSKAAWDQYNSVYREMVAAIRAVDSDRVLCVEGIWRVSNLPMPAGEGWTNMMYQLHLYDDTSAFKSLAGSLASYAKKNNVAVYVGEFSNLEGISICESYGINWTTWTYKGGRGPNGTWFMYYGYTPPVTPGSTDFNTALRLWGQLLRTDSGYFFRADDVYNAVKKATS